MSSFLNTSYWKEVFSLDNILSYTTTKVVVIRDRRLGFIHRLIQLLILAYIVGYVFIYKKQYLIFETSTGSSAYKIKGVTLGRVQGTNNSSFFDAADLIQPSLENGAIFVTTRMQITTRQERGWCKNEFPIFCNETTKCVWENMEGVCNNGICEFFQWCPDENGWLVIFAVNSAELDPNITQTIVLDSVDRFTIWFKDSITFTALRPQTVFSTIQDPQPIRWKDDPVHGNLFSIGELLQLVNIDGGNNDTSYEKVREKGAILRVSIDWSCNLDAWDPKYACDISYKVKRLDNAEIGDGLNYRRISSYEVDGKQYRDLTKYFGIRIFIESKGVGYSVNAVNIILQLSSGLALLVVATTICDLMIQYLLPQKKIYSKYKVQSTPKLYKGISFKKGKQKLQKSSANQDLGENLLEKDTQVDIQIEQS